MIVTSSWLVTLLGMTAYGFPSSAAVGNDYPMNPVGMGPEEAADSQPGYQADMTPLWNDIRHAITAPWRSVIEDASYSPDGRDAMLNGRFAALLDSYDGNDDAVRTRNINNNDMQNDHMQDEPQHHLRHKYPFSREDLEVVNENSARYDHGPEADGENDQEDERPWPASDAYMHSKLNLQVPRYRKSAPGLFKRKDKRSREKKLQKLRQFGFHGIPSQRSGGPALRNAEILSRLKSMVRELYGPGSPEASFLETGRDSGKIDPDFEKILPGGRQNQLSINLDLGTITHLVNHMQRKGQIGKSRDRLRIIG